jgi:hypothetical protein
MMNAGIKKKPIATTADTQNINHTDKRAEFEDGIAMFGRFPYKFDPTL